MTIIVASSAFEFVTALCVANTKYAKWLAKHRKGLKLQQMLTKKNERNRL
jgi:hypothetical protein